MEKKTALMYTAFGAAGEVTGSKHLLETPSGSRILLDCGLFQGKRDLAMEKNCDFGFDPKTLNAVLISHAHIDHIGLLPKLVKDGFEKKVYATEGTEKLADPLLKDSSRIQQEDEKYIARHHIKSPYCDKIPLYENTDVDETLKLFEGESYETSFSVTDDVTAEFLDAGHVFGSAVVVLRVKTNRKKKTIVYTGDLGRKNLPIIKDPTFISEADVLIIESTYGNRSHERILEVEEDMSKIINETVKRGGKIFIPAFALERTQEIILRLEDLIYQNKIPNLSVYLDSPLAIKLSKVFEKYPEYYDDDLKQRFEKKRHVFSFPNLHFTESVEDSKKLNTLQAPCIIIAGSGMAENGRIRHHLKNCLEDPRHTFLFVGYQAENTLGRKLIDGRKVVSIFNKDYSVNAQIIQFKSMSAHADQHDLDSYIQTMKHLKKIVLVHGEEDSRHEFAKRISAYYKGAEIILPKRGARYEL